jgi:hypothetical protein
MLIELWLRKKLGKSLKLEQNVKLEMLRIKNS